MTDQDPWTAVEDRLTAFADEHWEVIPSPPEPSEIRIRTAEGRSLVLRVTREGEPASDGDVQFVGHAREDLERLVNQGRGTIELTEDELDEIEARVRNASPGPWRAFLKTKGGIVATASFG
jgi:hypothetical protein